MPKTGLPCDICGQPVARGVPSNHGECCRAAFLQAIARWQAQADLIGACSKDRVGGSMQYKVSFVGGVVGVPADGPLPTTTTRGTQNQVAVRNPVYLHPSLKPLRAANLGEAQTDFFVNECAGRCGV